MMTIYGEFLAQQDENDLISHCLRLLRRVGLVEVQLLSNIAAPI